MRTDHHTASLLLIGPLCAVAALIACEPQAPYSDDDGGDDDGADDDGGDDDGGDDDGGDDDGGDDDAGDDDGGDDDGPALLYDGDVGDSALVPGWDPEDPSPLIVFSKYDAFPTWFVSMAEVDQDGVVGGVASDWIRFWGW